MLFFFFFWTTQYSLSNYKFTHFSSHFDGQDWSRLEEIVLSYWLLHLIVFSQQRSCFFDVVLFLKPDVTLAGASLANVTFSRPLLCYWHSASSCLEDAAAAAAASDVHDAWTGPSSLANTGSVGCALCRAPPTFRGVTEERSKNTSSARREPRGAVRQWRWLRWAFFFCFLLFQIGEVIK